MAQLMERCVPNTPPAIVPAFVTPNALATNAWLLLQCNYQLRDALHTSLRHCKPWDGHFDIFP